MGTGSPLWGWVNALAGYSGNTTTCSYGNYANLQMAQTRPDPFRQLCNHDFHGLLDKFKGMRDGTAKA